MLVNLLYVDNPLRLLRVIVVAAVNKRTVRDALVLSALDIARAGLLRHVQPLRLAAVSKLLLLLEKMARLLHIMLIFRHRVWTNLAIL